MPSQEFIFVNKGLWFANEAPMSLKGVYKRLNVYPPGTNYSLRFDTKRWRVELEPAKGSNKSKLVNRSIFEMRDWMRDQLRRVVEENRKLSDGKIVRHGSFIQVDFGAVMVFAGEALEKTIRANTKLPMEAFVVYATALMVDPDRQWRKWLVQCLECDKIFYSKPTGGSRAKLCSPRCKKLRNADRVRRHREAK